MAPQQEWFEKDYYKVLGVAESASPKDISKAYKALARKLHPDANPNDKAAEERFKDITAAYDVIGDEEKRAEYDKVRRMGPGMFGGGGGGQGGAGFNVDFGDLGDIFGGLFGGGGGGGRRGGPQRTRGGGPQRGKDLETTLHMAFEDAVNGIETSLQLTSEARCSICSGTGAEPGSPPPRTCATCQGSGVTSDSQGGMFGLSRQCTSCGGRGISIEKPCHNCSGKGTEVRPRNIKTRIPAGVAQGQKIRMKGRGGPGRSGGPPGDLFITVDVAPHRIFGRDGKNLTVTLPVTISELVLGADVAVPTLDGGTVKVRIAPGTPSGRTLRVKGRGAPVSSGAGDLLVTVEVAVPKNVSTEEKDLYEALTEAATVSPRAHLEVKTSG